MQGDTYHDGIVLTDPVVCSRDQRFGPSDLGPAGISTFIARHKCTQFCKQEWSTPANPVASFPRAQGTSMVARDGKIMGSR